MLINTNLIQSLIQKKSIKQKEITLKLGTSPQKFKNWMSCGQIPKHSKIEQLASILGIDTTELYATNTVSEPESDFRTKMSFSPEDLIPFHEIDPNNGITSLWLTGIAPPPKDYIYLPGLKADLIFPYFGQGMSPQLSNGDWIALRKMTDLSFFNYGNLYAVITKELAIVRNLKKSKKKNFILLSTLSSPNDDIELPIKAIKALYTIVTIIKRNTI